MSPGRDCHCLSPADIMADKEGVTLSLEEEDDADVALAYKTPAKKSLQEIQQLDPGDESLRKYKQALLGTIPAAVGKAGGRGLGLATPSTPGTLCQAMQPRRVQGAGASLWAPSACAHPAARRHRHSPAAMGTAARGPRLPWLQDHRRSFHRNGYKGPGNSLG